MTDPEFIEWLEYHLGAFTHLRDWVARMDREQKEETLRHWKRALSRTDLDDAKAATGKLFDGEESEPKSRDKIPAAVAAIARRIRGDDASEPRWQMRDPETVGCLTCNDVGMVICWDPATMQAVVDGKFPSTRRPKSMESSAYTCAVPCSCRQGDRTGRRIKARYDPRRWCVLEGTRYDKREQDRLVEFMAELAGARW